MADAARKLEFSPAATYEELLKVPEHLIAEIINGELHTMPRPAAKHARAASMLDRRVGSVYDFDGDEPDGWIILFEPELHLGEPDPQIFVPDLAGWRRSRMPSVPDVKWFDLPPDWVCEIISPSSTFKDRVQKMPVYAQFGVEWLWLVDPDRQTLEAYQLVGGKWLLLGTWGDEDKVCAMPFTEVEIPLQTLWS